MPEPLTFSYCLCRNLRINFLELTFIEKILIHDYKYAAFLCRWFSEEEKGLCKSCLLWLMLFLKQD